MERLNNNPENSWGFHISNWVNSLKQTKLSEISKAEHAMYRYLSWARSEGIADYLDPTFEELTIANRALALEPDLELERRPSEDGNGLELEVAIDPRYTEEELTALERFDLKDFLDNQEATAQVVLLPTGERLGEAPIHLGLSKSQAVVQLPAQVTAKDTLYVRVINCRIGFVATGKLEGE